MGGQTTPGTYGYSAVAVTRNARPYSDAIRRCNVEGHRRPTKLKALKTVSAILGLIIVMPIWYYLIYQVLIRVHATELMMFLFWVYLPVGILSGILQKIIETQR